MSERSCAWWRDAVVYQVYVRSFADDNGDGIGDLAGVRSRLPYLRDLGVDALWFTPWYRSPLDDGGYDVQDYRAIHEDFGALAEAEALIREALEMGIRTIVDIVPNHVSDQHEWFQRALAAPAGSPERERFWFHPGIGPGGEQRPTEWISNFQGDTWTRTTLPDGSPGDWYMHLFAPQQPDLNWNHPDVRAEHEDVLRFWLDRGAAGVRVDSASLLTKDPALPEVPLNPSSGLHPFQDRDDVHDIYRSWRAITDSYADERILVGEVWLPDPERFTDYLRSDEMHTAFNFDLMSQPWDATLMRASIENTLTTHSLVGAPSTWVLSNHDVTRPVTRYGREESGFAFARKRFGVPSDLVLGLHRARAAAVMIAALPGSLYLYQGDELGLPEVEDLPVELLQDPMHFRSGRTDPGRDGCRVPMPWEGITPPFGFNETTDQPWLPQPADWRQLTVEHQRADPHSTLHLYRTMLALRRRLPELREPDFSWVDGYEPDILAFRRGNVVCLVNFSDNAYPLPAQHQVLLNSNATAGNTLGANSAVWLRSAPVP